MNSLNIEICPYCKKPLVELVCHPSRWYCFECKREYDKPTIKYYSLTLDQVKACLTLLKIN